MPAKKKAKKKGVDYKALLKLDDEAFIKKCEKTPELADMVDNMIGQLEFMSMIEDRPPQEIIDEALEEHAEDTDPKMRVMNRMAELGLFLPEWDDDDYGTDLGLL